MATADRPVQNKSLKTQAAALSPPDDNAANIPPSGVDVASVI
jgi:hypothetical protein